MKNKRMLFAIAIIVLLTSNNQINAQTDKLPIEENSFKHGIGAGAGYVTGYGLSYRYTPNKLGFQINFAPYHSQELDRYSLGFTFIYSLIKNRVSSLFIYQGNHYYYNSEITYIYEIYPTKPFNPEPIKKRVSSEYINNGLGFGIELTIAKRIGFNLMGGYAFYSNFEEVNLTGETALYYKF